QKRPADTVANAIRVAKILTGEVEEDTGDSGKDKAAQSMGRRGGAARRDKLTPERRAEIARKAAAKRWSNSRPGIIWVIFFLRKLVDMRYSCARWSSEVRDGIRGGSGGDYGAARPLSDANISAVSCGFGL